MARFLVQTIPNKLPELLINLSSQGPHLMGATLSTLLRAVHPGTIAMSARMRLDPSLEERRGSRRSARCVHTPTPEQVTTNRREVRFGFDLAQWLRRQLFRTLSSVASASVLSFAKMVGSALNAQLRVQISWWCVCHPEAP